jgi:WD40-like Beta Propeller Repeat
MFKKYIIFNVLFFISVLYANAFQVEPALEELKSYSKIRDFTMNIDETEIYVTAQSNLEERSIILKITIEEDEWKNVSVVPFSGVYKDLEPFLSPDNLKLYFVSNRPIHQDSIKPKDYDIWVVERNSIKGNWSLPKNLGAPINTVHNEFYPSVANNGNLYFTSDNSSSLGKDDIFMSEFINGAYAEPTNLNGGINTKSYEYNAFIAPDESYLIFGGYNRKDGFGSGDLYISFKNENNIWTEAKNLGKEINSKYMDFCPFVVKESNLLYFTSRRSNLNTLFQIDSVTDLLNEFNSYQNGFSRIYKINFDILKFKN